MKTIVFFCKSDATEYFHRRVAKATCTKYRACAHKLFAVFRSLAVIGPRPVLSTPPEPLQINMFGEFLEESKPTGLIMQRTSQHSESPSASRHPLAPSGPSGCTAVLYRSCFLSMLELPILSSLHGCGVLLSISLFLGCQQSVNW